MAMRWGEAIRLSIFGESHGPAVGITVDGLPAGEEMDLEALRREMARRAPGKSIYATARREADEVQILSGLHAGKTTGAPLCGVIYNADARSGDYDAKLRPGHADMTALVKYGGFADMRGGGHFSGRLTAPLVFAGALAKQILARRGVVMYGRIAAIAGIGDGENLPTREAYSALAQKDFPVADGAAGERMKSAILAAKEEKDSVGGVVEAAAFGVPAGLGEPFFYPLETAISSLLFAVPAVKGVEFGDGFSLAGMRGSEANDAIVLQNGKLVTETNHNGGILGGISNGMPVVVRCVLKPTPTIGKAQQTVDGETMRAATIEGKGRHDPCIVPRAVPVVESCVALALLDALLLAGGRDV